MSLKYVTKIWITQRLQTDFGRSVLIDVIELVWLTCLQEPFPAIAEYSNIQKYPERVSVPDNMYRTRSIIFQMSQHIEL